MIAGSESIFLATSLGDIVRLESDGSLDSQFGFGGWSDSAPYVSFLRAPPVVASMTLQPDGKLLVVGRYKDRPFLSRQKLDGKFDQTFGDRGAVLNRKLFSGQPPQEFTDIAVARDGRIYTSGVQWRKFRGQPDVRGFVSRFLPNGRLDRSFGLRGRALFSGLDSTGVYFSALELSKRGRIIVLRSNSSGTSAMALNQKGRVIRGFGGGRASISLPYANRLETAPSGRIMAFGVSSGSGGGEAANGCARLYAFNWAGIRSSGFSTDGVQYLCPSKFAEMFPPIRFDPRGIYQAAFGLQGNGKSVVSLGLLGRPWSGGTHTIRLRADGSVDRTFAEAGLFRTGTPARLVQVEGLPEGVLVAGGDNQFKSPPGSFVYRFGD
jgi:uncharacterized delta-60 repeat protein